MAQPKKARAGFRFLFVALGLGLAGVLAILTRGYDAGGITQDEKVAGARLATLAEIQSAAEAKLGSYAWIDQEKGVVQLPIERAMELTVADLASKNKGVETEVKAVAFGTNLIPPYLKEAAEAAPAETAPAEGTPTTEGATPTESAPPAPAPEGEIAPSATPVPATPETTPTATPETPATEAATPQANP